MPKSSYRYLSKTTARGQIYCQYGVSRQAFLLVSLDPLAFYAIQNYSSGEHVRIGTVGYLVVTEAVLAAT